MSWMAKLYDTYGHIEKLTDHNAETLLWPISHFVKNAHIEVVIDNKGKFLKGRSRILHGEDSPTLIPASEASAGRSGSKIAPHPLCEEIGYCSVDYPKANQKKVKAYFDQLRSWANSIWEHPKLTAILKYLDKKTLWNDVSSEIDFPLKVKTPSGTSQKIPAEKVFLRWSVEEPGNPVQGTWDDETLINSWIEFDREKNRKEGFCYIIGEDARRGSNHPRFLRWPGDGAKLVSSNDSSGFTFRGRFTDSKKSIDQNGLQAVGISFEATQKAHNALRWLISRQGYRTGDQVYVAWAVSGKDIPKPLVSAWEMLGEDISFQPEVEQEQEHQIDHSIDLGSTFSHKLNKYLAGYQTKLEPNEQIVIMGLDSATPGRMSIIYYRELLASEFFDRVRMWHIQFAWSQRHTRELPDPRGGKKPVKKTIWPVSSPVPRLIVETAYGNILKSNDKLKRSAIERILPCIIDGRPFPQDIMISAVRRTCNRMAKRLPEKYSNYRSEKAQWEKHLGVACALFKGFFLRHPDPIKKREYAMTLEDGRTTRDYLYGRMLAIAERIEEVALSVGGENRPTTAARMMQRFADRPFSTWRTIELALQPYMQRLQGTRAGFLVNRKKELDKILAAFDPDEFESKNPLSGEFLLGYHCQRQYWQTNKSEKQTNKEESNHES